MVPDIITKLQAELDKSITTEVQVVYLMAGIRKIMERDDIAAQFEHLEFYCNWALHTRMDRRFAQMMLDKFNQAHIHLVNGMELHDLPQPLRKEIDQISSMSNFREELSKFLERYSLATDIASDFAKWSGFMKLYGGVVQDCSLVIKSTNTNSQIVAVTVSYIEADEVRANQLYYKISWVIEDRNGSSGTIEIINSYQLSE